MQSVPHRERENESILHKYTVFTLYMSYYLFKFFLFFGNPILLFITKFSPKLADFLAKFIMFFVTPYSVISLQIIALIVLSELLKVPYNLNKKGSEKTIIDSKKNIKESVSSTVNNLLWLFLDISTSPYILMQKRRKSSKRKNDRRKLQNLSRTRSRKRGRRGSGRRSYRT